MLKCRFIKLLQVAEVNGAEFWKKKKLIFTPVNPQGTHWFSQPILANLIQPFGQL